MLRIPSYLKIYWRIRSLPELRDLPPNEQIRLIREFQRRGVREWRYWAACLSYSVAQAVMFALLYVYDLSWPVKATISALGFLVINWRLGRNVNVHQRSILRYLRKRDYGEA